jgi:hypothetical protein
LFFLIEFPCKAHYLIIKLPQAPYREPKLPPPDFIPTEYGVGVPLPPEDEDEYEIDDGVGEDDREEEAAAVEYEYVYKDDDEVTNEISDEFVAIPRPLTPKHFSLPVHFTKEQGRNTSNLKILKHFNLTEQNY